MHQPGRVFVVSLGCTAPLPMATLAHFSWELPSCKKGPLETFSFEPGFIEFHLHFFIKQNDPPSAHLYLCTSSSQPSWSPEREREPESARGQPCAKSQERANVTFLAQRPFPCSGQPVSLHLGKRETEGEAP